jgi:protein-S-isoprenylcysteine O-methyltransferase Ste14
MNIQTRLALVVVQAIGYAWHLSIFGIVVPFFIVTLSRGTDYLLFDYFMGVDLSTNSLLLQAETVVNLFALVVFSLGLLIILEATLTLYSETRGFPFSSLPHERLRPQKLAISGWYAWVRHPMLLGYLLMLGGLGVFMTSATLVLWWVPLLGFVSVHYYYMSEEKKLLRWFGDEYKAYQSSVPALIPRLFK